MNKILEVKNLTLKLNNQTILKDICFDVDKGSITTLIGLNGSGKTSILRCVLGIFKHYKGHIKLHTKKIGYVPQRVDFDKSIPLTVIEFLKTFTTKPEQEIDKSLEESGVLDSKDKKFKDLSGGQIQRVLIANALLQNPEIIFLDEPTSGIDIKGEENFYKLIENINKKYDISILLVSHDIHTVFGKSDKIICIEEGQICCQGNPCNKKFKEQFEKTILPNLGHYHHH